MECIIVSVIKLSRYKCEVFVYMHMIDDSCTEWIKYELVNLDERKYM